MSKVSSAAQSAAIRDFHNARARAGFQAIVSWLKGEPVDLLSFDEVSSRLRVTGQSTRGVKSIPVESIVGSVGRYRDFTRTFLPRQESDVDRWTRVKTAARTVSELPAIDVYQIGDAYFVLDGNHRVSIAREQGIDFIDARVTEVRTRVPLASSDRPEQLIVKTEYAEFLEHTKLDQLRPDADLMVSEPGQYMHLENLIEVYRYYVETEEETVLSNDDAVCRWYDHAYLPLVQAIREQGILRYFPDRTETDFYVWLARHRALLQHELGWHIRPEVAVSQLSDKAAPPKKTSLARRVVQAFSGGKRPSAPESWAEEKVVARYSHHLFADILAPVSETTTPWPALRQALAIAAREQAQLCGLHVITPNDVHDHRALVTAFDAWRDEVGVAGRLALEAGDVVGRVCQRAALTDMVVWQYNQAPKNQQYMRDLLGRCTRPVLLVNDVLASGAHALLVFENQDTSYDALFVTAYLGEVWQTAVTVLGPSLDYARDYLGLHEVQANYERSPDLSAQRIAETAAAHDCDLILLSGGPRHADLALALMALQERPLLLCP